MALTDDMNTTMLVSPANAVNGNQNGFFGGDFAWVLLLLVLGGGWGGFGGFGMGGAMMGMGMMGMDYLYPWLNNSQNINDGFRDQALGMQINGIQNGITSGFGDVQTALCGGFAGVNAAINGAQSTISQQLYNNEIAGLERSFAAQTANTAALNGVSMNLQNCCCENRANIADLKYTVATENCADRYEAAQNTQNIITALTAGIQSIKDDLCAERLEAQRRENDNLRSELMYARGQASQVAQTAAIEASQTAQTQYIVNRIAPYPIPSYTVNPIAPVTPAVI